jgi:2-hydroxycyclohexanecarboxyl-CoA dehydrogenase
MSLAGRVVLVTGAARGIGAAVADAFGAAGASVAVGDVDVDGAAAVAARVSEAHQVRCVGVDLDVTSRERIDAALEKVEADLGPLDVLVNNAGIDVIKPFFHCCQAVLVGMIERGRGAIVNFASDAGRVGSSGEAVYSATKGGVLAFTKTLARETARHGIRVNCVSPGPTDTALLAQVADADPKLRDALARSIPMRRVADPDDIAPAVVFLAGDGARYITGQTLSVSGGLTMA